MRQDPVPHFMLCVGTKSDPVIQKITSVQRIAESLKLTIDPTEGIPDDVRSLPSIMEIDSRRTYQGEKGVETFIRQHEPLPPPRQPDIIPKLRVPPTPRPSLEDQVEPIEPIPVEPIPVEPTPVEAPLKKKRAPRKKAIV